MGKVDEAPFVFGVRVEGDNFTDRREETERLKMNFLKALTDGVNTGFTQSAILGKYHLGTAANITRLKKSLTDRDLITTVAAKQMGMCDPILALWLKKRVFR